MLRYSQFLFLVVLKKKSIYFCFLFLCMSFALIFIPSISETNNLMYQGLFPIDTFIKWFPFVFSTIFSSLLIIRIFKTGEKDGTELLISAKPITRKKIILAKFFIMYIMIIIFHIFLFLFYIAIVQFDKYATSDEKLKYSISITVGGIIISIIIGSIIVIMSSFFGKVTTIISGILFAAVIPIISFVIVPISNATSPIGKAEIDLYRPVYFLSDTKKTKKDVGVIYDPEKQTSNGKGMQFFNYWNAKQIKDNKNTWYNYAKYGDFWYQLERFYSLFEPTTKTKSLFSYDIKHASYNKIDSKLFNSMKNEALKMSIKKYKDPNDLSKYSEYIGFFSKDELEYEKTKLRFNIEKYHNLTKKNGLLVQTLKDIMTKSTTTSTSELIKSFKEALDIDNKIESKYLRILLWRAIHDYQKNNELEISNSYSAHVNFENFNLFVDSSLVKDIISNSSYSIGRNWIEIDKSKEDLFTYDKVSENFFLLSDYKEEKYLETIPIIIFWSILAAILIITSVVIYLRKDFK